MTAMLREAIADQEKEGSQVFYDLDWIKAYLLAFAELYRDALYRHVQSLTM